MPLISSCKECNKKCCPLWRPSIDDAVFLGDLLKIKGWSKTKLSKIAALTPSCITQICNGDRDPRLSTWKKIADSLDISISDIKPGNAKKIMHRIKR